MYEIWFLKIFFLRKLNPDWRTWLDPHFFQKCQISQAVIIANLVLLSSDLQVSLVRYPKSNKSSNQLLFWINAPLYFVVVIDVYFWFNSWLSISGRKTWQRKHCQLEIWHLSFKIFAICSPFSKIFWGKTDGRCRC